MGLDRLIAIAAAIAVLAATTGQLPKAIRAVQFAQLEAPVLNGAFFTGLPVPWTLPNTIAKGTGFNGN